MIDLYTDATPNGLKTSIALEELGLEYRAHRLYLGGEQKTPEFTQLNPNQKIPVLVDGDVTVTESGAILYYLAQKTGRLLPQDMIKRTKVMEMLMLQMSGLGPNFGQFLVWAAAWGNEVPQASERYQKEVIRLFSVLEQHLDGQPYFAGNEFTIADIAFLPWIRLCHVHPVAQSLPLNDFKNLSDWYQRVIERESVQRGLLVPEPHEPEKMFKAFVSSTVGLGELHNA